MFNHVYVKFPFVIQRNVQKVSMKKNLFFISVIGFSIISHAFESAPLSAFASSAYSGHEEITRQALNNVSKKIKDIDPTNSLFELSDLSFDLKPEPKGLFGYKSKNMIIHGNFSSDFPKQTTVLNLADFWKDNTISEYESPSTQVIHFLRNYKDPVTLDSAYNTCQVARKNIKYITSEAIKAWDAGDKTKALFLIGHATHTIQDSFSPAHTRRDDEAHNYNLKNVCFYGSKMHKKMDMMFKDAKILCYHEILDSRDTVWNISPDRYKESLKNWNSEKSTQCDKVNSYPQVEDEKTSCLDSDARLARTATEKYLFLVFNQISPLNFVKKSGNDFLSTLDTNLFDGPVGNSELDKKMSNGIMRCEGLTTEIVSGYSPAEF